MVGVVESHGTTQAVLVTVLISGVGWLRGIQKGQSISSSLVRQQKQQLAIMTIITFIPTTAIKSHNTKMRIMHGMLNASPVAVASQTILRMIQQKRNTMIVSMISEMRLLQKKPYLQMLLGTGNSILMRIIITVNLVCMILYYHAIQLQTAYTGRLCARPVWESFAEKLTIINEHPFVCLNFHLCRSRCVLQQASDILIIKQFCQFGCLGQRYFCCGIVLLSKLSHMMEVELGLCCPIWTLWRQFQCIKQLQFNQSQICKRGQLVSVASWEHKFSQQK